MATPTPRRGGARLSMLVPLIAAAIPCAFGQVRSVHGVVTDQTGEPLKGAISQGQEHTEFPHKILCHPSGRRIPVPWAASRYRIPAQGEVPWTDREDQDAALVRFAPGGTHRLESPHQRRCKA